MRAPVLAALTLGALLATSTPVLAADDLVSDACPGSEVEPSFYFDAYGNAHERGIDCLAWWGVTGGVEPGRYGAEQQVTRAQMATFVARTLDSLGVPLPAGSARFPDVTGGVHADNIHRLGEVGIVSGGADGRFRPTDVVPRGQMATFLVRSFTYATGEPAPPAPDRFPDDEGSVHEPAIDVAAARGWAAGGADGTFAPGAPVRRDQMASFLSRMLGSAVRELPGGRDNPVPAGEPIPLVDGWVVSVLAADPDATEQVLAENLVNEPPAEGRQYVLVRVRGTYTGGGSSRLGTADLRLLGGSGATYSWFSDYCGVVPDALDDRETFQGGSVEGNLCYSVPSADVPSLRLYDADWQGDTRTRLYGLVFGG